MLKVAVVGCGVVGASWALVFARAGLHVSLFDAAPAAQQQAVAFVRSALTDDDAAHVAGRAAVDVAMDRVTTTSSLEEALIDVDYVQESAPERLQIKRELYKLFDTLAPANVVIGSSTSGLPASAFTEGLVHASRCLVVHPINPPHLIPLVEIVPAPWTAPEAVAAAAAIMRKVGQAPILLSREINGFVVNRLQSAMLAEAFRLVEDGICDSADVDRAVADGLGLRWFFMGPFETIDLNAQAGIAEYCKNLGPMYHGLAQEQADPRDWSPALVKTIEDQRRLITPAEGLADRRSWRDRCLAILVAAKRQMLAEQGR